MRLHQIDFGDPWDFEQVYEALFNFTRAYPFDTDSEDYLIHITTGTHVAQICLFLLTESRWLPGRLIQCSPDRDRGAPGKIKIIDLDLSRYDRIASRFQQEQREGVSYLKGGIETRNTAFNRLIDRIEQVAIATRDPLLLMGPTGAGKSRLARRIYELKKVRLHRRRILRGRFLHRRRPVSPFIGVYATGSLWRVEPNAGEGLPRQLTLTSEDLGKVRELLKLRPIQFCIFLKALVGVEEVQRLMVEAVKAAKQL
jgi:hypothetical protein